MSTEKPANKKRRVLIVDDHPMTREGLFNLLNREPDLVVCSQSESAEAALDAIAAAKPDLVLTDLKLPGKSGLELIKDIKVMYPELPVLVISMHDESFYAERVLRAGARGYSTKSVSGEKLLEAIRNVLAGQIHLSKKMSARIMDIFVSGRITSERGGIEKLSDREFEVFSLMGEGLTANKVGDRLKLSTKTVDAHRANIKSKLGIKTTAELIAFAARWNAN